MYHGVHPMWAGDCAVLLSFTYIILSIKTNYDEVGMSIWPI